MTSGRNENQQLVQVQDLLHELIGGEGHSLGGNAADVVERKASVQSILDPELVVHVREGLPQRSVQMMEKLLSKILEQRTLWFGHVKVSVQEHQLKKRKRIANYIRRMKRNCFFCIVLQYWFTKIHLNKTKKSLL